MRPSKRRTAAWRMAPRRPSEDLPVHEVTDDQRHGETDQDSGQQDEEERRRAGQLARVAAPAVDGVDASPLPGCPVLPDPPDEDQRQRGDEAPKPGEGEPV